VTYYVPGLGEKDPDKTIRSLMQAHEKTATNTDDIATNTAAIAAINAAGYVVGPASATDNALVRFDATTGKLVHDSQITLGDSDGKLTRSGGISASGTSTNDDAAAGYVGEYISSTVLAGSAVSLTTNIAADITSISLTAGDWDVTGAIFQQPNGATVVTLIIGWISTTSASLPTAPNGGGEALWAGSVTGNGNSTHPGPMRLSLSGTTTVYLSTFVTFTTNTNSAYGIIRARRVR
jgi:hypothetical protein